MYFLWALSSKAECDRWCEKPGKDVPLPHCLYLSPACKSTLLTINKHQLSQWELSSIKHLLFPPPHHRSIHLSTHSETTPRGKKKKHTHSKKDGVWTDPTLSQSWSDSLTCQWMSWDLWPPPLPLGGLWIVYRGLGLVTEFSLFLPLARSSRCYLSLSSYSTCWYLSGLSVSPWLPMHSSQST